MSTGRNERNAQINPGLAILYTEPDLNESVGVVHKRDIDRLVYSTYSNNHPK
jgi:hypothetical protein